jgi:hypothetical protein
MEKTCQSEEIIGKNVLLIGASNLGHSVPHFAASNLEFTSVIKPGWIATAKNVAELVTVVKESAPDAIQRNHIAAVP